MHETVNFPSLIEPSHHDSGDVQTNGQRKQTESAQREVTFYAEKVEGFFWVL